MCVFACFVVATSQIVFTDDMAVNPVGVVEEVLEFLGLSITDEDESKASVRKRNGYPVIKVGTTRLLVEFRVNECHRL